MRVQDNQIQMNSGCVVTSWRHEHDINMPFALMVSYYNDEGKTMSKMVNALNPESFIADNIDETFPLEW